MVYCVMKTFRHLHKNFFPFDLIMCWSTHLFVHWNPELTLEISVIYWPDLIFMCTKTYRNLSLSFTTLGKKTTKKARKVSRNIILWFRVYNARFQFSKTNNHLTPSSPQSPDPDHPVSDPGKNKISFLSNVSTGNCRFQNPILRIPLPQDCDTWRIMEN